MEEKKSSYRGFTEAQSEAHKRYMKNFVEIKVRMTPEKRAIVQDHAAKNGESATAFINRAIDEAMERDNSTILPDDTTTPEPPAPTKETSSNQLLKDDIPVWMHSDYVPPVTEKVPSAPPKETTPEDDFIPEFMRGE